LAGSKGDCASRRSEADPLAARERFWGLTEDVLRQDRRRSAAAAATAPAAAEREAMARSLVEAIALARREMSAPATGGVGTVRRRRYLKQEARMLGWGWGMESWETTSAGKFGASFAVPAREKKAVTRSLDEGPFLVWAYGPRRL